MIAYTIMFERAECDEPVPCEYDHRCETGHRKKLVWMIHPRISLTLGPMHGHLNRAVKGRNYISSNGTGPTGNVQIMVIDTAMLKPLWSEAEQAAYKIGGLEAVQQLQKGQAKAAREAERAKAKAEKEALNPKRGRARRKRLDEALGA